MKKPTCPKCGSTEYARERTPDGYTTCKNEECGYKAKSVEWDKSTPNFFPFW